MSGRSSDCEEAVPGESSREVSCEQLPAEVPLSLDCALLHVVPRAQVAAYLRTLERKGPVECDDGTELDALGVS